LEIVFLDWDLIWILRFGKVGRLIYWAEKGKLISTRREKFISRVLVVGETKGRRPLDFFFGPTNPIYSGISTLQRKVIVNWNSLLVNWLQKLTKMVAYKFLAYLEGTDFGQGTSLVLDSLLGTKIYRRYRWTTRFHKRVQLDQRVVNRYYIWPFQGKQRLGFKNFSLGNRFPYG